MQILYRERESASPAVFPSGQGKTPEPIPIPNKPEGLDDDLNYIRTGNLEIRDSFLRNRKDSDYFLFDLDIFNISKFYILVFLFLF